MNPDPPVTNALAGSATRQPGERCGSHGPQLDRVGVPRQVGVLGDRVGVMHNVTIGTNMTGGAPTGTAK